MKGRKYSPMLASSYLVAKMMESCPMKVRRMRVEARSQSLLPSGRLKTPNTTAKMEFSRVPQEEKAMVVIV